MAVKNLDDLRWIPLLGDWRQDEIDSIRFYGGENNPSGRSQLPITDNESESDAHALINFGQLVFNERFTEGKIKSKIRFDNPDYRSSASIVIQTDVVNNNILMFGLLGGFVRPEAGSGPLFLLRRFGQANTPGNDQSSAGLQQTPAYTNLFRGGQGRMLNGHQFYDLEIEVRGAVIRASIDDVEVMRYTLDQPSLTGDQVGLFCGGRGNIDFIDFSIETSTPKVFVVMQFNTPEYESLYTEVIEPLCKNAGLEPYRGDSTYLPGLIIEDIKKNIEEARLIIAEITPNNANVYFEVGYADALKKPIILIADRKEGLKPFDVRAYRTIFYENSIGGKRKVESDLKSYLASILGR